MTGPLPKTIADIVKKTGLSVRPKTPVVSPTPTKRDPKHIPNAFAVPIRRPVADRLDTVVPVTDAPAPNAGGPDTAEFPDIPADLDRRPKPVGQGADVLQAVGPQNSDPVAAIADGDPAAAAGELTVDSALSGTTPSVAITVGTDTRADTPTEKELLDIAHRVRHHIKRTRDYFIEIGRDLNRAKAILPHGQFIPFIRDEFGMADRTARTYMLAAKTADAILAEPANLPGTSPPHLLGEVRPTEVQGATTVDLDAGTGADKRNAVANQGAAGLGAEIARAVAVLRRKLEPGELDLLRELQASGPKAWKGLGLAQRPLTAAAKKSGCTCQPAAPAKFFGRRAPLAPRADPSCLSAHKRPCPPRQGTYGAAVAAGGFIGANGGAVIMQLFWMPTSSMASRSPFSRAYSDACGPSPPSRKKRAGQNRINPIAICALSSFAVLVSVP